MKSLRQWINWQKVQKSEWGKPAKVPFCFKHSRKIDAQELSNWISYQEAKAFNENVGFVLSKNDPYFCIDLDNALVNGAWAPHVQKILNYFPNAYVEISDSGKGLHIFGRSENIPAHRNKIKIDGFDVELYSQGRFIAFSEISSQGDYNHDFTHELAEFVNTYFAKDEQTTPVSLKEKYGGYLKADKEWIGPEDDAELIKRMLSSTSITGLIAGKATVNDLWTNNISALSRAYPDNYGKRAYDSSSADFALCVHLAWWTGNDGPRMERIARLSALVRPKWDNHVNYLSGPTGTIFNACKGNKTFYRDPKQVPDSETTDLDDQNSRIGPQFLDVDAQKVLFNGCVYIVDQNRIFTPENEKIEGSGGILDRERFNFVYGGFTFALTHKGKPTTRNAFDAFRDSQGYKFPRAKTSCFRPQHKPGEIIKINGYPCVNTYIPAIINFGTGKVEKFLFLLRTLFPNEQDYLKHLSYIAALVQYPGVKFKWCMIIQGVEGNGKSTIAKCIAHAIGEKYVFKPQAADLGNKFNSWLRETLFIQVEEINTVDKREAVEALKIMITEERVSYQAKGIDTVMGDNVSNWYMTTNYKDAMMITIDGRRYFVHYCPQQKKVHLIRDGLDGLFFARLYKWLNHEGGLDDVAGFLMRYPIPDHLNPATSCQTAPDSTSLLEAVESTQSAAHGEIREAIEQELPGFCGGWVSSYHVAELLDSKNLTRYFPFRKRRGIMKDLGYVPAPWMPNGRSSKKIPSEDSSRPILYVLESKSYDDVLSTDDYIKAQSPPEPISMKTTSDK